MPLELFFVIALTMMMVVTLFALKLIQMVLRSQKELLESQRSDLLSLTKLAAAKDIGAYSALEAGALAVNQVEMPYTPMDDESVARALAEQYAKRGISPELALSQDSDPLEDFGGMKAFI
jgi:hypothetical protein